MSMGFPGKFESSNLSRDNVSREIGRIRDPAEDTHQVGSGSEQTKVCA